MGQDTVSSSATEPGRLVWPDGRDVQAAWRSYVRPLLGRFSQRLDLRLVRTLRDGVEAVIRLRLRPQALWLTELGSLLLGTAHAPAGVKRLARLLAADWSADEVEQWLLEQADALLAAQPAGEGLVSFDQSVVEKPESARAEGLCRVRSAKARRLARHRAGFSSGPPATRPVVVPGWHWLAATVTGWSGPALLACCRWWSPTAPTAPSAPGASEAAPARQQQTASQSQLVQQLARRWGPRVLFVLDRGFAGRPFLHAALAESARLVVRWPKRYRLVRLGQPAKNATTAWRLTAGQRAWGTFGRWDRRRRCWLQTSLFAVPVRLPDGPFADYPLWLVVSRRRHQQQRASRAGRTGKVTRWVGDEPWRLLTTEPVQTLEDAQRIVQAYARRWQVELAFRFGKSELGVESIRVRGWERQAKLLALLSLAYSFLIWLLQSQSPEWLAQLLRRGCHRTGQRLRAAATPLYRLRAALAARLAAALPPPLARCRST